jgi:hypothetical protein
MSNRITFRDASDRLCFFCPEDVRGHWADPWKSFDLTLLANGAWVEYDCRWAEFPVEQPDRQPYKMTSPEEALEWFLIRDLDPPACLADLLEARDVGRPREPSHEIVTAPASEGGWKALDIRGARKWELETRGEDWQPFDDCYTWYINECLYRRPDGTWYLISQRTNWMSEVAWDKECEQLTKQQAAEKLVLSGHALPDDLAELVGHRLIADDPPVAAAAPRPEAKAETPAPAGPPGDFRDFKYKQRDLLLALDGRGRVPISEIGKAVYPRKRFSEGALMKLKDRTNDKLSKIRPDLEIKRFGDTMSLERSPPERRPDEKSTKVSLETSA